MTSILPSLIVHLLLRHFADDETRQTNHEGFNICMKFIHKLKDIYWHAGFYHELFEMALTQSGNNARLRENGNHPVLAFLQGSKSVNVSKQPERYAEAEYSSGSSEPTLQTEMSVQESLRHPRGASSDVDGIATGVSEAEYPPLDGSNAESVIFEDWLKECGYYYNSLPSA